VLLSPTLPPSGLAHSEAGRGSSRSSKSGVGFQPTPARHGSAWRRSGPRSSPELFALSRSGGGSPFPGAAPRTARRITPDPDSRSKRFLNPPSTRARPTTAHMGRFRLYCRPCEVGGCGVRAWRACRLCGAWACRDCRHGRNWDVRCMDCPADALRELLRVEHRARRAAVLRACRACAIARARGRPLCWQHLELERARQQQARSIERDRSAEVQTHPEWTHRAPLRVNSVGD
jgi:hypothetical protein